MCWIYFCTGSGLLRLSGAQLDGSLDGILLFLDHLLAGTFLACDCSDINLFSRDLKTLETCSCCGLEPDFYTGFAGDHLAVPNEFPT